MTWSCSRFSFRNVFGHAHRCRHDIYESKLDDEPPLPSGRFITCSARGDFNSPLIQDHYMPRPSICKVLFRSDIRTTTPLASHFLFPPHPITIFSASLSSHSYYHHPSLHHLPQILLLPLTESHTPNAVLKKTSQLPSCTIILRTLVVHPIYLIQPVSTHFPSHQTHSVAFPISTTPPPPTSPSRLVFFCYNIYTHIALLI